MSTLTMSKPYGTYQQFNYQTVDLSPVKTMACNTIKFMFYALVFISLVVLSIAAFNLVFIAASWVALHFVQIVITLSIFVGAWMLQPKVSKK